ncbi:MAG: NAD-dependent protein deacylase, partial [Rhodocyclaceae bacterium]|nr:NAD-dependent protein deacylase [Rhodocyclaceae bacterium]
MNAAPTLPEGVVDAFARARRILFITGAGISADSGLPTYRGFGGLYDGKPTEEGLPIEEVLSGQMLARRPELT